MALASVDSEGRPNVRMVLLKGADADGFVFYTNLESAKGLELGSQSHAALCLHWKSLRRQVRVRGPRARSAQPKPTLISRQGPRTARSARGLPRSRAR